VCDEDGSGLVNYVEFKTLLESLGMRKSESELQAICSDLDADNSGEIDRDEFIHWFSNLQLRTNCDLSTPENIGRFVDHIFCVIDKDNSDNISTEEVR
jgi:Ca2+-binding EF-hand superfamily protein